MKSMLRFARTVAVALLAVMPGACVAQAAEGADDADATADEQRPAAEQRPPEAGAVKIPGAAETVTGALQGQEGVRIQTMCTHCNSANIQVGGLRHTGARHHGQQRDSDSAREPAPEYDRNNTGQTSVLTGCGRDVPASPCVMRAWCATT